MTDWWLIGLTAGIVLFTALLWWSTHRLVRGAERTATHQLRAYVGAKAEEAPDLQQSKLNTIIVIRNFGQTPAYDLEMVMTLKALDWPAPPIQESLAELYAQFGRSQYVLWPGAELRIPLSRNADDQLRAEIESGQTKRLIALGELRYTDAFKAKRYTKFCFFYGGPNTRKTGRMHYHNEGNEADSSPRP